MVHVTKMAKELLALAQRAWAIVCFLPASCVLPRIAQLPSRSRELRSRSRELRYQEEKVSFSKGFTWNSAWGLVPIVPTI